MDEAGTGCLATDQRGIGRPQGFGCDAGAFELVVVPTAVTLGDATAEIEPSKPLVLIMVAVCLGMVSVRVRKQNG